MMAGYLGVERGMVLDSFRKCRGGAAGRSLWKARMGVAARRTHAVTRCWRREMRAEYLPNLSRSRPSSGLLRGASFTIFALHEAGGG